jgi:hypothetical protein
MNMLTNTPEEENDAFDLPAPDPDAPKAKPRIHKSPSDSTCVSCEG